MEKLTYLYLGNASKVYNANVLDNLPELTSVTIDFKNKNSILNSINELNKINRTADFSFVFGAYSAIEDDELEEIAEALSPLKVKNIYFSNLYKSIYVTDGIGVGTSKTITFNEANPFLERYILNENSVFYNPNAHFRAPREDIISIDMENKTITITSNEADEPGDKIEYINYDYGNGNSSSMTIYYRVVLDGDHETEINIPDQELKRFLLNNYDIDKNGIITEYDMLNINNIYVNNVYDLTGLEYARNLVYFGISSGSYERVISNINVLNNLQKLEDLRIWGSNLNINCLDFGNISSLRRLTLGNISSLTNVQALNNLANLRRIELRFGNYGEVSKLSALNNKDDMALIIELEPEYYGEPIENEILEQIVNTIEGLPVENVIFLNILQPITIDNIAIGDEVTLDFDDVSPWIKYIKHNQSSKLYQPNFILDPYFDDENVTTDNNNEQIIIRTDENSAGEHALDYGVTFHINEYETYSTSVTVYYRVMVAGDKNKEVIVNDPNLRDILIRDYNFDGQEMISEYDMYNIEEFTSYSEIADLTGLESAINLKSLSMYNASITDVGPIINLPLEYLNIRNNNNAAPNLNLLSDLTHLTYLGISVNVPVDLMFIQNMHELEGISITANNIYNAHVLNGLEELYNINLTSKELEGIEGLGDLQSNNENMYCTITITNYNRELYSREAYQRFIESIANMRMSRLRVYLNDIYVDMGEFEANGEPVEFTYDEISPVLGAMISNGPLNQEVNLELEETYMTNNNEDAIIDSANQKVRVNTNTSGLNRIYMSFGDRNYHYEPSTIINGNIMMTFNVVFQGDKTKLIDIPDDNLRRRLEEEYNFDGEPGISEYDMKNMSELYLGGVQDFTGLENATNLKTIYISVNRNSNISALSQLESLRNLEVGIEDNEADLSRTKEYDMAKNIKII